jgi:coenzyme F420-dependent glucose-6-phosphate dehydrogenase
MHHVRIGYKLCSEERDPLGLVEDARRAEDAGFDFAAISDHFHPWIDKQGESPFVWTSLGAIATATQRITVGTAVTCPTVRQHPALVAQAAATAACLLPGRFFLGVGTGERLNEHIFGDPWPSAAVRREMLGEAVEVLRELWTGELTTYDGRYYTVDTARLYTLPDEPVPLYVAASGTAAASLAAEIGDGLVMAGDARDALQTYLDEGGNGPRFAELTVNVADDEERALAEVHERWPNPAIPGELSTELPLPRHFEQAASATQPDDIRGKALVGTDVESYLSKIEELQQAGYTDIFLHQVGRDQDAFFRFANDRLLPAWRSRSNEAA